MTSNVNSQPSLDEIRELLSPYLDGEVSEEERLQVEEAIATSDELRQELDMLRQTVNLLAALPPAPAPRPFTLSEVDVQPTRPAAQKRSSWFSRWTGSLAMAAVALLCVLIVGGIFYTAQFNTASAPAEIALYEESAAPAEATLAQPQAVEQQAEVAAEEEAAAVEALEAEEEPAAAEAQMAQEAPAADEAPAQEEMAAAAAEAVEEAEADQAEAPEERTEIAEDQETTERLVVPEATASPGPAATPQPETLTALPPAPPQVAEAGEAAASEAAPALKSAPQEEAAGQTEQEEDVTTMAAPAEEEQDLAQQAVTPDQATATPLPPPPTATPLPTPTVVPPVAAPAQLEAEATGWLPLVGVIGFGLLTLLIVGFVIWRSIRRS